MERINKKKKFVKNGLFYAELNEFLRRELAEDGYAGCEVRVTPKNTEVVIKATRTEKVCCPQSLSSSTPTVMMVSCFLFVCVVSVGSVSVSGGVDSCCVGGGVQVLGENPKGRRINELTSVIQKRFDFPEGGIEVFADRVKSRGLSAMAQCESLKFKLASGLAVRRSVLCWSVFLSSLLSLSLCECSVCVLGVLAHSTGMVCVCVVF